MKSLEIALFGRCFKAGLRAPAIFVAAASFALLSASPVCAQSIPQAAQFLDLSKLQTIERHLSRFAPVESFDDYRNTFWNPEWPPADRLLFFDAVATALVQEIRSRNADVEELGAILLELDPFDMGNVCADPSRACYTWKDIRNSTEAEITARVERGETLLVDARDQLFGRFISSAGPFLVALEETALAETKTLSIDDANRLMNEVLTQIAVLEARVLMVRALVKELKGTKPNTVRNEAIRHLLGLAGVSASSVELMENAVDDIEDILAYQVAELNGTARQVGRRLQREVALKLKAKTKHLIEPYERIVSLRSRSNCGIDLSTYLPGVAKPCWELIEQLSDPTQFTELAKQRLNEKAEEAKKSVEASAKEIGKRFTDEAKGALKEISPFELVKTNSTDNDASFDVHIIDYRADTSGSIRENDSAPLPPAGKAISYVDTGLTLTYARSIVGGEQQLTFVRGKPRSVNIRKQAFQKFLQSYGLPSKIPFDLDYKNFDFDEITQRLKSLKVVVSIPVPFVKNVPPLVAELSLPPDQDDVRQTRESLEAQVGLIVSDLQGRVAQAIATQSVSLGEHAWLDGFREGDGNSWSSGTVDYRGNLNVKLPGSICSDTALKAEIRLDSNNWGYPDISPAAANQSIIDCFSSLVESRLDQAIAAIAQIATDAIPNGVYRILVEGARIETVLQEPVIEFTACISGGTNDDPILPVCEAAPDGGLKGQKVTVRLNLFRSSPTVVFNPSLESVLKREAVNRWTNYVSANIPNEVDIFGFTARIEPHPAIAGSYHLTIENAPGNRRVRVSPVGITVNDNGRPAVDFNGARVHCAALGQAWGECVDINMLGVGEFGPVRLKPSGFAGQALTIDVAFRDPFSSGGDYQSAGRVTIDPINKRINASDLKPLILAQVRKRLKEMLHSSGILGAHKLSGGAVIDVKMTAEDSASLKTLLTSYDVTIRNLQLGPLTLPTTVEIRAGNTPKIKIDRGLLTGLFKDAISKQLSMSGINCTIGNINDSRLKDLAVNFGCRFDIGGVVQIGLDNIKLDARGLHMPEIVDVPIPGEVPLGTTGLFLTNLKVRVNFKNPDIIGMMGDVVPVSAATRDFIAFESRLDLYLKEQKVDARGDLLLLSSLNLATYEGGINLKERSFFWDGRSAGQFDDIFSNTTRGSTNGESGITEYASEIAVLDIFSQNVNVKLTAKAELDASFDFKFLGFELDGAVKTGEKLKAMKLNGSGKMEVAGYELSGANVEADPYGAELSFRVLGLGIEVSALSLGSITKKQVEDSILSLFRFDELLKALMESLLKGKIKIALFQPVGSGDGNSSPMSSGGNQGHAKGTGTPPGPEGDEPPGGVDSLSVESGEDAAKRHQRQPRDPRSLTTHYDGGRYNLCSKAEVLASVNALRVWTVLKNSTCPTEPPPWAPYFHPGFQTDLGNPNLGELRRKYLGVIWLPHETLMRQIGREKVTCRGVKVWAQAFIDTGASQLIVHTEGTKFRDGEVAPKRTTIPFSALLNGVADWNAYLAGTFADNIGKALWSIDGLLPGDRKQLEDDLADRLSPGERSNCDYVTKGSITVDPVDNLKSEDFQFFWQVRELTGDARLEARSGRRIWVPKGTLLRILLDNGFIDSELARDLIGLSYGSGWEVLYADDDVGVVIIRVGGEPNVRVYRNAELYVRVEIDGMPDFRKGRTWNASDPRVVFLLNAVKQDFVYVDWSRESDGAFGAVNTEDKVLRINPVGHAMLANAMDPNAKIDVTVGSTSWKERLRAARVICPQYGQGVLAERIDGLSGLKEALYFFESPPTDRYCVNARVLFGSMAN